MEIFLKLLRQTAMWVDISQGRWEGGAWGSSDAPFLGGHFIYLIPSYAPEIPILKLDEYRIHFIYKYIHSVEAKEITPINNLDSVYDNQCTYINPPLFYCTCPRTDCEAIY